MLDVDTGLTKLKFSHKIERSVPGRSFTAASHDFKWHGIQGFGLAGKVLVTAIRLK